jgi:hypothetical protein
LVAVLDAPLRGVVHDSQASKLTLSDKGTMPGHECPFASSIHSCVTLAQVVAATPACLLVGGGF